MNINHCVCYVSKIPIHNPSSHCSRRCEGSSALTFTGLCASVCSQRSAALETISYLLLWLQPKVSPGSWEETPQEDAPFRHRVWLLAKKTAPLSTLWVSAFCVQPDKSEQWPPRLSWRWQAEESRKPAFENSAIKLHATPRAWPESTFWQPQEAIVLFFKHLSAWKKTTWRERECLPKGS